MAKKKKNELDNYGLEPDDEFYERMPIIQTSDEGTRDIKTCTNALMILWKVRMGNEDTIDISEDCNHSMLNFESTYSGGESEENNLTEDDEFDLDHIIEVDEESMILTFYSYVAKPIPDELISNIGLETLNINSKLKFGNFELHSTNSNGVESIYLRYRTSACLKGVKVGKVEVIENLISNTQLNLAIAFESWSKDADFKNWLLT